MLSNLSRVSRQFNRFKITNDELDFVLKYAPVVAEKENAVQSHEFSPKLTERVEMLRRILTDATASQIETALAKKQMIPGSCGEISYQIRNLDIKIQQLRQHMANNGKDFNTKRTLQDCEYKQMRNLKYLKKKNPFEFVKLEKELSK